MNKDKELEQNCCWKAIKNLNISNEKSQISCFYYTCKECGKHYNVYPSEESAKSMKEHENNQEVVNFLREELSKRNYYSIYDPDYNHHGEIILRELQEQLADLEMKILAEVKGDQTIIYLQPEKCCSLVIDEVKREPIKLPLISLPVNTKEIKYFDYFPSSWKHPTFGFKKDEEWNGELKDIWENREKNSCLGTSFPKAKEEMMEELKNKGFKWQGGEKGDEFVAAICPRCNWNYNCYLFDDKENGFKYLKTEDQEKMVKIVKNHEC